MDNVDLTMVLNFVWLGLGVYIYNTFNSNINKALDYIIVLQEMQSESLERDIHALKMITYLQEENKHLVKRVSHLEGILL